MTLISLDIEQAVAILNKDGIIALPTETVYGLAGNAYSEAAVKKIFALKQRPFYNPLIVHIRSVSTLNDIAQQIPETALKLAEKFWPGPLTLVLKKQPHISDIITAGKETVAVRVPNHPVALAVLDKLTFPLAAPSANPFGSISPTSADHVYKYFGESIDFILDGGACTRGVESTIVGFDGNTPVLYRHGSISVEDIENVVGKLSVQVHNDKKPDAPGMLTRHYAPSTETYLTDNVADVVEQFKGKRIGLLLFQDEKQHPDVIMREILSSSGDLAEATTNLYAALHRLDRAGLDVIIAEKLPDIGLGRTLNDRLQRAIQK
jgi:L-threonylcarbamoyladenylate synthase